MYHSKGYVTNKARGEGDGSQGVGGVYIPHKIGILTSKRGKNIKILK